MTIRISGGDLFASDIDALVIPVNCVGVMGAGLAKEAARRWPSVQAPYKAACRQGWMVPGKIITAFTWPALILAPTKKHWRDPSELEYVEAAAAAVANEISRFGKTHGWVSIGVPALGCGLGGLAWADVEPVLRRAFADVDVDVVLFPPRPQR